MVSPVSCFPLFSLVLVLPPKKHVASVCTPALCSLPSPTLLSLFFVGALLCDPLPLIPSHTHTQTLSLSPSQTLRGGAFLYDHPFFTVVDMHHSPPSFFLHSVFPLPRSLLLTPQFPFSLHRLSTAPPLLVSCCILRVTNSHRRQRERVVWLVHVWCMCGVCDV